MTDQQKKEFFLFLQKFCADNAGNRLNEWIIEAFLNRANQRLESIPTYGNEASASQTSHANHASQASQTSSQASQDVATRSGKREN
jgi:hypothetical protein